MDPSKYFANRLASVDALKAKGLNPYPHKFNVSLSLSAFIAKARAASLSLHSIVTCTVPAVYVAQARRSL